jgi:glutamate 5-kinase
MIHKRIVIKFGTSTLTGGTKKISLKLLFSLVSQIVQLHNEGYQIIIVSSGAIAVGKEALNFPELPKFIPGKQMLAAVGQPRLMGLYDQFFRMHGETVAQVLLTRFDLSDRRRYLNARNTLEALIDQNIIPIINENDTVATEEIRFGDNDRLSALVANLIEADTLILLTDQAGLFTEDPRINPNAQLISHIDTPEIPEAIWEAAGGSSTGLGTGGMVTKLRAADLARRSGTTVYIAPGNEPDILLKITQNEQIGSRFSPIVTTLESRKRYLLAVRASGSLYINQGAMEALKQGGSLLPVGIIKIEGNFDRGDTVKVISPAGKKAALGIVNYSAIDLPHFCGHKSADIEQILGFTYGDEVIHRNNLLML